MKWIGQHIWDFISRFRSDVYLEATETGTIASGGNLGLDSNNKIVKADTESGELSFTGSTANGVLTYLDADSIQVESTLVYTDGTLTGTNSTSQKPNISLINTNADALGPSISLGKVSSSPADDDILGTIEFDGNSSTGAGDYQSFADIVAKSTTILNTDEAGSLTMRVRASDGSSTTSMRDGISLAGHGTSDLVNVGLGYGATSTTTLAGTLTMGSTAFVNNSGVVQVATQGTIDHDSLANFVAAEHYAWASDISGTATIHTNNITDLHGAGVDGSANQLLTDDGDGTITSESTASLTSSVSTTRITLFSPANSLDFLTIDAGANGATTLTTIDADAALANFEIAADGNITLDAAGDVALECGNNGFTCDAGNIDFSSSGANRPTLQMINSEDDATGPSIILKNNRDGNGLEDDDVLGEIKFVGEDASGNFEQYGGIIGSVVEADHGDEAGQIAISVANDGTERNGITMTADKGTAQEVDVTIANGTSSTTTIAGHLTVTTEATIPSRKYELPSSTVGDYKGGDIYYYGDGSTVKGKIYGIDGTNWSLADADSEAATKGLLAVALGTDPDVDGMLLRGFVTLLTEIEGTEAIGSPLYLSATDSGIATVTVPASGDFVRVLGYSLHASDNQVYFNPDNTWVERA